MQIEKIVKNKIIVIRCDFCKEENVIHMCDLCQKDFCDSHGKIYQKAVSSMIVPTYIYQPSTFISSVTTDPYSYTTWHSDSSAGTAAKSSMNYITYTAPFLQLCQECIKPEYEKILEIIKNR